MRPCLPAPPRGTWSQSTTGILKPMNTRLKSIARAIFLLLGLVYALREARGLWRDLRRIIRQPK